MKKSIFATAIAMKKYLFTLIASVMALSASAQTMSIKEQRDFYHKAYVMMGEYARSASVVPDESEDEEYTFRHLFVNNDMQICNDLMSLSREPTLSVDDYITTLQGAKRVKVTVRNIKKEGLIEDQGDKWLMHVVFEKGISYSKSGTFFNSHDFFGQYYHLKATFAMDKYTRDCKITALEADPDYQRIPFPEKYTVLERTPEDESKRDYLRDNKLTINNRDVRWNQYGQVILHDGDKIRYNNSSVKLEVVSTGRDGGTKIRADYNDKSYRIRPNMGYSLSGFNQLAEANSAIQIPKNNEMSYGIDFGYVLPSTSKFYVGFFTGLNMSSNSLIMEMAPQGESSVADIVNCTQDEDGDTYTRHYLMKGNGILQELKANNLTVPLYGDFEYQLLPLLSTYVDLGVKFQMKSGKWTAVIDGYETSGKDWGNSLYKDVEIKGDVNLNGFGSWPSRSIDVDEKGMENSLSIQAMGGVGLRANLSQSFALDVGLQYVMGGSSWKMDGNKKYVFDYTLPKDAQSESEKAKGDKVNLLRQANGIKHSALRLSASIIYKF